MSKIICNIWWWLRVQTMRTRYADPSYYLPADPDPFGAETPNNAIKPKMTKHEIDQQRFL